MINERVINEIFTGQGITIEARQSMVPRSSVASLLRQARNYIYRGKLRSAIRRSGLNRAISDPYWKLVYAFSGETQAHIIDEQIIKFKVNTFTEFMRFRDFSGEQLLIEDLLRSLKPEDTFYDIGANVGTYTCFAAAKLGWGRTIAFEPEPQNVKRLRENLALNNLDAEIVKVALSDTNGTAELALSGDEAGEGEHAIAVNGASETIEVKTARGDTVIKRHELPRPTVVKIDVEGAEMSVLRGMKEALREDCRLIYVEIHPQKITKFNASLADVEMFLEEAGFEVERFDERNVEVFLRGRK